MVTFTHLGMPSPPFYLRREKTGEVVKMTEEGRKGGREEGRKEDCSKEHTFEETQLEGDM